MFNKDSRNIDQVAKALVESERRVAELEALIENRRSCTGPCRHAEMREQLENELAACALELAQARSRVIHLDAEVAQVRAEIEDARHAAQASEARAAADRAKLDAKIARLEEELRLRRAASDYAAALRSVAEAATGSVPKVPDTLA